MTNKELIVQLLEFPMDAEVRIGEYADCDVDLLYINGNDNIVIE